MAKIGSIRINHECETAKNGNIMKHHQGFNEIKFGAIYPQCGSLAPVGNNGKELPMDLSIWLLKFMRSVVLALR